MTVESQFRRGPTMNIVPFAFSIHPGEILRTEFMEPVGLTAYRLPRT